MSVSQIPNLTPVIAMTGNELFETVQAGSTFRCTAQQIANLSTIYAAPSYTTAEKIALPKVAGRIVLDTTLGKLCFYTGSAWQTITSV